MSVIDRMQKTDAVTQEVGRQAAERIVEVREVFRTIDREIPIYVTKDANARCDVPLGFVRLHDSAAAGAHTPTLPDPAAATHDSASGVELSAVTETVIENYGICHAEREKLRSLQAWITAQAEAWNQN